MNLKSLVERKLSPQGKSGNDIIYGCPNCENPDQGHHLYVNYDKGYWHCFKCGSGGKRIESLLKILNIDIDYNYDKLYTEQDKELDDIINPVKKIVKKSSRDYSTDLSVLTEYYHMHTKPLSQGAYQYLLDRGLSPYTINKLKIVEGINLYGQEIIIKNKKLVGRDYSGRIMIPSLRRDNLISFYVGRDYIGNRRSKYVNPPKELVPASEDIWNLANVESDSVIICEGVLTAIAASPIKLNSVATYGKSIASKSSSSSEVTSQGEKLINKKFKNYYVVYDADAHEEAIKTCKYLYERGANVYIVLIDPEKYGKHADVDDIGYEEFISLLKDAIHYEGDISLIDIK